MKDKLYEVQAALWLIKEVLKKAIKPGPALDYGKINARANASVNPEAKAIADTAASNSEKNAPTIDYHNDAMKPPVRYAGAAEKAKAVRAKLDAQANPTALDTMKARQARPSVKKMDEEDGDIESMSKDELDVKIKSKLKAEMDKRNFGEADATKHVIDRDKGAQIAKLPKPPKILN